MSSEVIYILKKKNNQTQNNHLWIINLCVYMSRVRHEPTPLRPDGFALSENIRNISMYLYVKRYIFRFIYFFFKI